MNRWELLQDRDADSRIYLALLGQRKNVYTIFKDFGGKSNDKEIPGLYTRPYIEFVVKKLARAKILKTSVGQSPNGKRPVLLYESDFGVYSEFLIEAVGVSEKSKKGIGKAVKLLFPYFNKLAMLPPERIKKFDALFSISIHTYCATQVSGFIFMERTPKQLEPYENIVKYLRTMDSAELTKAFAPIYRATYDFIAKNVEQALRDLSWLHNEISPVALYIMLDRRKIPKEEKEEVKSK